MGAVIVKHAIVPVATSTVGPSVVEIFPLVVFAFEDFHCVLVVAFMVFCPYHSFYSDVIAVETSTMG